MIKPHPSLWRETLKRGMAGADVAAWQEVLGSEPRPQYWQRAWPIRADGGFGPITEDATTAYKLQRGLPGDGVVDAEVRNTVPLGLFAPVEPSLVTSGLPPIAFVQAKVWRWMDRKTVDWIVIHSAEVWEKPSSAEAVASYFKNPHPPASAHFSVDCDSIVQSVRTEHAAGHCGPGNSRSIGIEQAGYARQSREEWLDTYSRQMLGLVARLVAREARAWDIPLVKLAPDEIRSGARGVCGHVDINAAFPGKSKHYDPGPHYPWDVLLDLAAKAA